MAKGRFSASLRRLTGSEKAPAPFRANSRAYDEAKATRAVRRLSKALRDRAQERLDAGETLPEHAQRWSYLVDMTLEEMLAEAEHLQKLTEYRIALLHIEPSCRALLHEVRQAVFDPTGDRALRLLRHAVAWRKVFGSRHANRLEQVLELASMGALVRNHQAPDRDVIYLATRGEIEGFEWNRGRTQLQLGREYLGSGYLLDGGRPVPAERRPAELVRREAAAAPAVPPPAPLDETVVRRGADLPAEPLPLVGRAQTERPVIPDPASPRTPRPPQTRRGHGFGALAEPSHEMRPAAAPAQPAESPSPAPASPALPSIPARPAAATPPPATPARVAARANEIPPAQPVRPARPGAPLAIPLDLGARPRTMPPPLPRSNSVGIPAADIAAPVPPPSRPRTFFDVPPLLKGHPHRVSPGPGAHKHRGLGRG